jgi:pilus assembly protein CpaC
MTTMKRFGARLAIAVLGASLAVLFSTGTPAEAKTPKINVAVGQSVTQNTPGVIKTVSVADSKVADVVVAGPQQILVNGKQAGFTTLVVWDQNNVSTLYRVVVRGAFSDQQIELRVQVAEVNRSKIKELGVDFLAQDANNARDWTGGAYGGGVSAPNIPLTIFGGNPSPATSLALRYVSGGTDVMATIHALQENGMIRVLAEPNVVASSGNEASFLSGGEFPIPVVQGGTENAAITIEFKEYGVKVKFVPTIVDSGVINLKVAPEVSNLDFPNGIDVAGGYRIPAVSVRKAETTVELEDGQVLVIGGLLREEEQSVNRKIPILGHIPLVGLLFSSSQTVKTQQELLLVVSPHIIRALPRGTKVALPGVVEEEGQ